MRARLLQQLATAAKILRIKKGYAESSLKRSATLILNNPREASKEAISLAQKFKASLVKNSKAISKSASKPVKSVTPSNFDLKESVVKHDKISLLNTFSKFRQRILIFDFIMGTFRNSWWAKPLLVAYLMISYVFSAYLLARLTFLIEIMQLDFWGIVDYIKNLDLNDIEGLFKEWEPVPYDPAAPNLGLNKVPVEADPFSGNYIRQIDPKEYAIDQINRAKSLADRALDKLSKTAAHLPDILNSGSNAYTKALHGLNEAYAQAINQYGSISDFRRALGLYTGVKGWFNAWIGYPLADAATWLFSGNPFYTILMFSLATLVMSFFNVPDVFSIVMYLPLKVLSFPVEALDWFMCNYIDSYIVWVNNKLYYFTTKTGLGAFIDSCKEMEGASLDDTIPYHNNNIAGYRTRPGSFNTDRMGQGVVRQSIIDYAQELGTYPEIPLDKGKGPDVPPDSFKEFLRGWFDGLRGTHSERDGFVPNIRVEDTGAGGLTPITTQDNTGPMLSTGTVTPRIVTRTGSGSITPTAVSGAVGLGVALETNTVGDALAAVSDKLSAAASPTTEAVEVPQAETNSPQVRFSADHLKDKDRAGGDFR